MKKLHLSLIILFFSYHLIAQKVSIEKAQKTAGHFLYEQVQSTIFSPQQAETQLLLSDIIYDKGNTKPLLYVFTINSEGFIIIPAHKSAFPVLSYSFTNTFDRNNMAPALEEWLKQYTIAIEYYKSNPETSQYLSAWDFYSDIANVKNSKTKAKGVSPLLTTKWNQSQFYNAHCPEDDDGPGGHAYAGCVATAMGQVMKYYNHPHQGTGSNGYNYVHWYSGWPYGYVYANFNTTYDWHAMPNSLNTHNDAVAKLLFHCGVSVNMFYTPNGSAASSSDVVAAAVNYFKYDSSTMIRSRSSFTNIQWQNMLRSSLDDLKPLYYSASSGTYGHAFNCDGYNTTTHGTHFHFNWGWGGHGDGFFYLNDMSSPGGNFNQSHQAIFDMVPASNFPAYCSGTRAINGRAGTFEDGSSIYNYQNNIDCRWHLNPLTNAASITLTFDRFDTEDINDVVYIYDGNNINAPLLGSFSGSSIPPAVTSTGREMLVRFTTNNTVQKHGWQASYSVSNKMNCSPMTILTTPSDTFSDGSMGYYYNPNTFCRWRIEPPGAVNITLGFHEFSLHPDNGVLQVYDISDNPVLIDEYYGSSIPSEKKYHTSAIMAWFRAGHSSYEGFRAYYSSNTAGIDKTEMVRDVFTVYPNPFSDIFTIQQTETSPYLISIYDISGKLLWQANKNQPKEIIDLSFLSKGIYFVELTNTKHTLTKRIVKVN